MQAHLPLADLPSLLNVRRGLRDSAEVVTVLQQTTFVSKSLPLCITAIDANVSFHEVFFHSKVRQRVSSRTPVARPSVRPSLLPLLSDRQRMARSWKFRLRHAPGERIWLDMCLRKACDPRPLRKKDTYGAVDECNDMALVQSPRRTRSDMLLLLLLLLLGNIEERLRPAIPWPEKSNYRI